MTTAARAKSSRPAKLPLLAPSIDISELPPHPAEADTPRERARRIMLTMKTKYALKALAVLANAPPGEPVLIAHISEQEDIPLKFLQLILRELKQHGVLQSRKGRGGGYALARPANKISLSSLIRILDGPIAPVPCLSKTAYRRCDGCKDENTCGVRLIMREAHEATLRVLEVRTLADLAHMTRGTADGLAQASGRYSI